MICVVQRVTKATVSVEGEVAGCIGRGLLALVAVVADDETRDVEYIAERLQGLRIFADDAGRMNRSVQDVGGGILLVSQFTLAADTRRGRRPSFTRAAAPDDALRRFGELESCLRRGPVPVQTGEFAARMKIELVNDGPVTLILDSRERFPRADDGAAGGSHDGGR